MMSAPPPPAPTTLSAPPATNISPSMQVDVKAEMKKESKTGVAGAFEVT